MQKFGISNDHGEYIMNHGTRGPINMQKNVLMVHGNQ